MRVCKMSESALKFGFTAKKIIEEGRLTQEDVDLVKAWLVGQTLPSYTDEQIVLFLLSCDKEQELTRATIKGFYTVRSGTPELFDNRTVQRENLQKQLKAVQFCVLPQLSDDGCAIIFFRFYDTYYYNFDLGAMLTLLFMTLDVAVYDHPPKGLIIVFDMKGMGLMHLTRLRPGLIMRFFQYVQEALPVKFKCMHILNSVSFINRIISLIKPFAKQEVLDVMYFHPPSLPMEEFYVNCIPKPCLPEDLGGNLPPVGVLHEENIKRLSDLQAHFDAEELQRRSLRTK